MTPDEFQPGDRVRSLNWDIEGVVVKKLAKLRERPIFREGAW